MRTLMTVMTIVLLVSCTTIPAKPTVTPPQHVKIRVLMDETLSREQVSDLLFYARDYFYAEEGIHISYTPIGMWRRPGFTYDAILDDIWERPLEGADHLMVLVSRNFTDFFYGLGFPEINGAVFFDRKRGFSVAEWGSLTQVLNWQSPRRLLVHELYHMFGYDDFPNMTVNYNEYGYAHVRFDETRRQRSERR